MNDTQIFEAATTSFSTRRTSHDPFTTDDFVGSTIGDYSDRHYNSRRSKYITIDAARILFEEEKKRVSLYAIPFKDASLARPRWTLEIIYDTGPRFIIQSRSRQSRPIFANAPSGVYGIAAELGVEHVFLCMPSE